MQPSRAETSQLIPSPRQELPARNCAWVRGIEFHIPCIIALYLLLMLGFSPLEGWAIGDCIYTAFAVMSTVGYGDFTPKTSYGRIYMCFVSISALVVLAVGVNEILGRVVQDSVQRIQSLLETKDIFDLDSRRQLLLEKARRRTLLLIVLICLSSISFALTHFEAEASQDGVDPYINGFYLTIITLTTVGFGDFNGVVPEDTPWGRVQCCFIMVVGIPVFAQWLELIMELVFGSIGDQTVTRHMHTLDGGRFQQVRRFQAKLKDFGHARVGKDLEHDLVTPLEFTLFMLVANGVVTEETIRDLKVNFDQLDVDGNGALTVEDVQLCAQTLHKSSVRQCSVTPTHSNCSQLNAR